MLATLLLLLLLGLGLGCGLAAAIWYFRFQITKVETTSSHQIYVTLRSRRTGEEATDYHRTVALARRDAARELRKKNLRNAELRKAERIQRRLTNTSKRRVKRNLKRMSKGEF